MTVYYYCCNCHLPYPNQGLPHICSRCGGIFEIEEKSFYNEIQPSTQAPGIWKYQNSFGLPKNTKPTYLGEGDTPLISKTINGQQVAFKLEYLNPTGSFKDRGTAVLTSLLLSRQISEVVEDSSGNAGASLAAYTTAFGIKNNIFVPESASGQKLTQMKVSGANVIPISGPRENAHQAALRYVQETGLPYASHALLPMGLAGIATISYELYEQLSRLPGTLVTPVGHGSLFTGIYLGIESLRRQQQLQSEVKLVGVQPARCAPLVAQWKGIPFEGGKEPSLAEGTQIVSPVRGGQILKFLRPHKDELLDIEEEAILPAYYDLARQGFYVEPTSALVWAAYQKYGANWPEPIVLILTGSGLKFIS